MSLSTLGLFFVIPGEESDVGVPRLLLLTFLDLPNLAHKVSSIVMRVHFKQAGLSFVFGLAGAAVAFRSILTVGERSGRRRFFFFFFFFFLPEVDVRVRGRGRLFPSIDGSGRGFSFSRS